MICHTQSQSIAIALCLALAVGSSASADYSDFLLNLPGVTSHWGMEETSGNTVSDSVTSDLVDGNNPGSFAGGAGASLNVAGPRAADGFAGFAADNRAIDFAGLAGQRLDMSPGGYTGTTGLDASSLTMWYRITATDTTQHVHLGGLEEETDGASGRYGLALNHYPTRTNTTSSSKNGGLRVFARTANPAASEVNFQTGYSSNSNPTEVSYWDSTWHQAFATFAPYGPDQWRLRLFVDGKLKKQDITGQDNNNDPTTVPSGSTLSLRNALTFGEDAGDNARLMVGQLDEIALFSRDVTPAEIGASYLAAKGITAQHSLLPAQGIVAHRGASDTHPENTLAAIQEAVDFGAHQVELDVQITSDGELVLMHDDTIDRTTDGTGRVQDLTLAQLKALDAGSWKGAEFAGEPIPTLQEALAAIPLNMWVNVEVKGVDGNDAATAAKAAEIVHQMRRTSQAFVAGGADSLAAVSTYESTEGVDILTNNLDRQDGDTSAYVATTISSGADFIQLRHNHSFPTPAEIQSLENAGVQINYFFSDDADDLPGLLSGGVEFVLANDLAEMMGAAVDEGIVPLLAIYHGDFSADGVVDQQDVGLFLEALADPAAYESNHPDFHVDIYGDFNLDGSFGLEDYEDFEDLITGGAGPIAGDYNLDGIVDSSDYVVWRTFFSATGAAVLPADGNGDGSVNLADYTVWRNNLGATGTTMAALTGTSVPEPATAVHWLLATPLGSMVLRVRYGAKECE
ncbi:glycerophosphodiester phosphodiesterase family protein [Aeoliella sp.]|uniref:glycerophosphodiester phosphodiesterase family protein n=1 Tax=Aeoliella sp. TaxID=2795800 RepID=UPI003CCC0C19